MSTQLRELFGAAADSQTPHDLAGRAVAGARRRRQQRFTVVGSVLAAAAVVLGVVMVSSPERLDGAPRPDEVAGLPDQLPAADGLPKLTDGTMEAASAAYVVDGQVVVIDAATSEGALVDFDRSYSTDAEMAGPTVLSLSPDGRFLWVSRVGGIFNGSRPMWLVNVADGLVTVQPKLGVFARKEQSLGAFSPSMAWAPNGETFACLCTWTREQSATAGLMTVDMTSLGTESVVTSVERFQIEPPRQISWGTDGLVGLFPDLDPEWRLVPVGGISRANPGAWPPLESVSMFGPGAVGFSAVAMGHSDEGGFLAKLALGKGGSGSLWVVPRAGEYRSVESVPSRPWLGALGDSYFVVVTDWKGDPYNDEVDRIDGEGETVLTTLPPGATTITFATDLVD